MEPYILVTTPRHWKHLGLVLGRAGLDKDCDVMGDPCVVWDPEESLWRMFLFSSPPGHGQAVCRDRLDPGPGAWEFLGPLSFQNPQDLLGGSTHKPFVVMRPDGGNQAAKVDGRYWLVTVSSLGKQKVIQRAWSERLAGPWVIETGPLFDLGGRDDFDGKHLDAVTAYYFEERKEFYYFYMGYPIAAQKREGVSPFGSAQAVSVQGLGRAKPRKLGIILPPSPIRGHWASGWVGGLQIFPGKEHRWMGLANASPTPPDPAGNENFREEPPPSLGGFAYTDAEMPTSGWQWYPEPIQRIEDLPAQALGWGEGTNLWRHHLLSLEDGRRFLFYNSGSYGKEQLYAKLAVE